MKNLKWFANCKTAEDCKAEYRKLAMKHHPDRGGDTRIMQEINAEYERAWDLLKNVHKSTRPDGPETYTAAEPTKETAADFIEIINELFKLDGLEIELCGRWLWIGGNTMVHKDQLKKLGCKWSKNKLKWSWHFPEDAAMKYKGKKAWSMAQIRMQFGSDEIKPDKEKRKEAQYIPAIA